MTATEMKYIFYFLKKIHLLSESNLREKKKRKYKSYNYLKLIINGFYLLRRYILWNKIHVQRNIHN